MYNVGTHVVKGTTGTAPTIQCSTNITTTTSGTVISYENNYCSMAHSHQSPIQCSESKVTSESGAAKSKPVLLPKPQKKVQRQPNPCTENKVTNAQASSESGLVKPAQQKPDPLPKPQKKTHQLENKTANLPTTVKSEPVKPIRPKPNPLPKPQKKAHTGKLMIRCMHDRLSIFYS